MSFRNISLLLIFPAFSGCATLAPVEDRKVEYIENTKAKKSEAYSAALAHFGKLFGNASAAIKISNAEAGQIVAKGVVECNVLRQFGEIYPHNLRFDLDFQAKDNRVRLAFENLVMTDHLGTEQGYAVRQLTDRAKVEQAKSCLEPIRAGLLKAIGGSTW